MFLQDTFYESDFEDDDDEENLKLPKIVSMLCLGLVFFLQIVILIFNHLF